MKRAGYEVKTVRGGGISFRLTGQGQERFTRLRASTLGDGYDLQDVLAAIEGKEKRPGRSERKISLAVDIQAKLAAGKGPGYERWAKVFNIKQMAAALAYIKDNNLTDYEQLAKKATEAADRFHVISEQVKQTEQAMKTNAGLKAATVQYAKTRPVFEQYKATKYSRKFLAEHEADLELYRAAQAEYYGAAEPPVRCGESHLSGLTEPPHFFIKLLCHCWVQSIYFSHREVFSWVNTFNIDLIGIIRYAIHDGIGKSTFTITDLLVPLTFTELRTKDC